MMPTFTKNLSCYIVGINKFLHFLKIEVGFGEVEFGLRGLNITLLNLWQNKWCFGQRFLCFSVSNALDSTELNE